MNPLWVLVPLLLFTTASAAQVPRTLDELLDQVRRERVERREAHAGRERRFRESRDQQQSLLASAKAARAAEQERTKTLKARFDEGEAQLAQRRADLTERSGALGELSEIARQVAAQSHTLLQTSLLSVQQPQRIAAVRRLADREELFALNDLKELWLLLLEEMSEAGKVARFPASVIAASGEEGVQPVTRVGVFTAVSDGQFLRHVTESGRLMALARQPPQRYRAAAKALEESDAGLMSFPLDPTRGAVLSLLVQTPDFAERIRQGGLIGYAIIVLGALGMLLALERFVVLGSTERKVSAQLNQVEPDPGNPLGRIMGTFSGARQPDAETLGLKLDEAILKELPQIQRRLGALSVIAGVAPLLGLLGTVTGMIQAFQSMSLLGTSDPKVMSGGISQALMTTELGLIVAVPLLLLHSFLLSKSNRLVQVLDEQSAAVVAEAAERHVTGT
jgi:biopolymer transport protein ExbB